MAKCFGRRGKTRESQTRFWTNMVWYFNIVYFIVGIVTVIGGIWLLVSFMKISILLSYPSTLFPIVVITVGTLVIILTVISIHYVEKPMFPMIYSTLLLLIFFLELGTMIVLIMLKPVWTKELYKNIGVHLKSYSYEQSGDNIMDIIQQEMECCGSTEPFDWYHEATIQQIPPSCCKFRQCDTSNITEIYAEGCYSKVMKFMAKNDLMICIILLTTTLAPFIGTIFTYFLAYYTLTPAPIAVPPTTGDGRTRSAPAIVVTEEGQPKEDGDQEEQQQEPSDGSPHQSNFRSCSCKKHSPSKFLRYPFCSLPFKPRRD